MIIIEQGECGYHVINRQGTGRAGGKRLYMSPKHKRAVADIPVPDRYAGSIYGWVRAVS